MLTILDQFITSTETDHSDTVITKLALELRSTNIATIKFQYPLRLQDPYIR